ncbi:MAG: beta-ketoacyl-ACP synthase III [Myxococcaceae bacterium]
MHRTQIIGTGSYAPEKVVTNHDIEKLVDTSDAWIVERTGIRERRMAAPDELTSDMAAKAALRAMEMAHVSPEDVDLIVVGTVSPDMPMPSCATFVQAKLGAHRAFAFDVSAACAGSIYGMSIADQYIRTGNAKVALVIGVELLTRIIDWTDRNTCVLFGDAAGAMLLGRSTEPERGILSTHLHSDGRSAEILTIPGGGSKSPVSVEMIERNEHKVHMSGREIYKFAARTLPQAFLEALHANGVGISDVKHIIAHQANQRIIESVMERLGVPIERCWLNISRYGNTSSASLPFSLDEANRAGKLKKGDLIAMAAIGAGMAWGSALVRW